MRDIRGDLQDRSNRLAEQISATQAQFDKVIEQLKLEHQGKLKISSPTLTPCVWSSRRKIDSAVVFLSVSSRSLGRHNGLSRLNLNRRLLIL